MGTTHQTIYFPEVKAFHVCLPSLKEQQKITCAFDSLNDKINLNRRMNATMEAMARAIFRAWFVDFEPVKIKAEGGRSFPGMPQKVFDSLPDRLVESVIGPIPNGWKIHKCKRTRRIQIRGHPFEESARLLGRRFSLGLRQGHEGNPCLG